MASLICLNHKNDSIRIHELQYFMTYHEWGLNYPLNNVDVWKVSFWFYLSGIEIWTECLFSREKNKEVKY
jgi:hypothetical protein